MFEHGKGKPRGRGCGPLGPKSRLAGGGRIPDTWHQEATALLLGVGPRGPEDEPRSGDLARLNVVDGHGAETSGALGERPHDELLVDDGTAQNDSFHEGAMKDRVLESGGIALA